MTTLFTGLGRMGLPMVRRYTATHDVVLHDANAEALAAAARELGAPTLADMTDQLDDVDVTILMLPSSRVVEKVLEGPDGLLEKLRKGSLIIDMGSSEPASTQRLARMAADRQIDYVDAPVSGGVAKAETGELAIMVGGETDAMERARPHLEPMGATITMVGPSGAGHAAKSLNNLLSATNITAAAEVLSVAVKFGIDPGVMIDVLNASTGRSQATEVKFPRHILTGTYNSGFALDLMVKDIGIAEALAHDHGVPLDVTATAARAARAVTSDGPGDHTEVARYVAERAHTNFSPSAGHKTSDNQIDNEETQR